MAIDKVVAPLLRVPLFAGLRPLQITEIARQAERIAFRGGGVITEAGRPGDGAYLIVSGDAVYRPRPGSTVPPQPVEPGSLVGELAMLVDHVYSATIVAEGRVHCLKILRSALYAQMEADPALADHLSGALTVRLTEVAMEMRRIDDLLAPGTPAEPGLDPAPTSPLWPGPLAAGTQP
jgi:CRP/FNR family transcriptional regulator, cyclic AMP receptor protein